MIFCKSIKKFASFILIICLFPGSVLIFISFFHSKKFIHVLKYGWVQHKGHLYIYIKTNWSSVLKKRFLDPGVDCLRTKMNLSNFIINNNL